MGSEERKVNACRITDQQEAEAFGAAPHRREARCPECGGWSAVEWDDSIPPGGLWWSDNSTGGCPKCGKPVLVESECEFRETGGSPVPVRR
jgi:endogenous inhibitor of DNA gyrase (YacG/DUF329 family)